MDSMGMGGGGYRALQRASSAGGGHMWRWWRKDGPANAKTAGNLATLSEK